MENKKSKKERKLSNRFVEAAISFARLSTVWLLIIFLLSAFELVYNGIVHQFPNSFTSVLFWSFLNDMFFWFKWLFFSYLIYTLVYLFSQKVARIGYCVFIVIMALVQLSLSSYFTASLVPLGADLYGYSIADIKQTVNAAGGVNFYQIIGFVVLLGCTIAALWSLPPRLKV
ncbi:MAG: hypothetical protein ACXVAU_17015, partial [Mucilaginibacter sp.]